MSRRQPKWARSNETVFVDLMCLCGRRLDRATFYGGGPLEALVLFLYDDVGNYPRIAGKRVLSQVKGRPATDPAEYMRAMGDQRVGDESPSRVRTLLCASCGARPQVSVQPIVDALTRAWDEGRHGRLSSVVVS